jgi:hypothetical protein
MNDINDLRHALEIETADLSARFPVDRIRRRARRLRVWPRVTMATAAVVAVAAGAVPATALLSGSGRAADIAGQTSWTSPCPPEPSAESDRDIRTLGPMVETGAIVDLPAKDGLYDVLLSLVGTRDTPGFAVAFRDRDTCEVDAWYTAGVGRDDRTGDIPDRRSGNGAYPFFTIQLPLGENRVLDVGLYTREAHRITVASEGEAAAAKMARNAETGWTLFWVERSATPLPDRFSTLRPYGGPDQVVLAAYDPEGRLLHTAEGRLVGEDVWNPQYNWWPADDPRTSPTP